MKWILIGVVALYVGFLILAPVAALVGGVFAQGVAPVLRALSQPDVLQAFGRTIFISLIVAVLHGVFGVIVAWVIVRHRFIGKNLLNSLIDLPFAISPVVVGYMLLLVFGRKGLLAPVLDVFHFQVAFALPGMVLATLFVTLPFMVHELIPVIELLDVDQEKAAATLGASPWQIFTRITFPTLRWAFYYGLTLTIARALGEFGAVLVIGGGIQGRTETAPIFTFRALDDRNYVGAFSAALVLGLVSLIIVMAADHQKARKK
jgi:sulfate/thiosulfate transport system permease protein